MKSILLNRILCLTSCFFILAYPAYAENTGAYQPLDDWYYYLEPLEQGMPDDVRSYFESIKSCDLTGQARAVDKNNFRGKYLKCDDLPKYKSHLQKKYFSREKIIKALNASDDRPDGLDYIIHLQHGMPKDIRSYLNRINECVHWGGEEPYDKARALYIAKAVTAAKCDQLQKDNSRFRKKYSGHRKIIKTLDHARLYSIYYLGQSMTN